MDTPPQNTNEKNKGGETHDIGGATFGMVEIILGTIAALIIDVLSAFADLLGGVGGFFIQALSWLIFRFWFTIKGCKVTASLARGFVVPLLTQFVPFIPTEAATFLVSVYMENHPEKFAMIEKASGAASGKIPSSK